MEIARRDVGFDLLNSQLMNYARSVIRACALQSKTGFMAHMMKIGLFQPYCGAKTDLILKLNKNKPHQRDVHSILILIRILDDAIRAYTIDYWLFFILRYLSV